MQILELDLDVVRSKTPMWEIVELQVSLRVSFVQSLVLLCR